MNPYQLELLEYAQPIAKAALDELRTIIITADDAELRITAAKLIMQFVLTAMDKPSVTTAPHASVALSS